MSWKREEPRKARPFYAVSHLSSILDGCSIMIGDRQCDEKSESISVEPEELNENDLTILLALDEVPLRESFQDSPDLLSLQVVIRDPMFKRREVIYTCKLLDEKPESHRIDAEKIHDFSHGREVHLTVAVVLSRDDSVKPGMPSRVGEWIAKRNFKLAIPSRLSSFRIHEMTPSQAKKWLGSEGALVYVEYSDGSLILPAEEGSTVADCYVAKRLLDRMKGKNSNLVNNKISSEIIYRVLRDATDDIESLDGVPDNSPLESVLSQMSAKEDIGLDGLKKALEKRDWLRALLEDRFNLVDIIAG